MAKFRDKIAVSRIVFTALVIIAASLIMILAFGFTSPVSKKYTVTIKDGCNQVVFYNCTEAYVTTGGTHLLFPDGTIHHYSPSVQIRIIEHPQK